jgi:hypothetical protein
MSDKETNFDKIIYDYQMEEYKEEGDNMIWTMKDGTEIMIKDMKDSHIKNTINMLNRKPMNGTRLAWIEIFKEQQSKRRNGKINKIVNNINLDNILGTKE